MKGSKMISNMNVFISHAHQNIEEGEKVKDICIRAGHRPYFYHEDKRAGEILGFIHEALQGADCVVLVQSEFANQSKWVFHEIQTAMMMGKIVIPYQIDQSENPYYPKAIRTAENIEMLEQMLTEKASGCVLVVGSANGETVFTVEKDLQLDGKNQVTPKLLHGGSGVNHALRLLHMGIPVFPILPIANDPEGRAIQETILSAARKHTTMIGPIQRFVGGSSFFVPDMETTPHSTVIAHGQKRAILKQESDEDRKFLDHLQKRLAELEELGYSDRINAIMIGHIAADRWPHYSGQCTKEALAKFKDKKCYRFANLGGSQIRLGYEKWKDELQSLDCFEANLAEIRQMMAIDNNGHQSLTEIIQRLIEDEITALITLDKFGAVGTFKGNQDMIVMAWPFELNDIKDTTGAGDAFGAGVVATALTQDKSGIYGFREVIDRARFWAAKACCSEGGSSECPTKDELESFSNRLSDNPAKDEHESSSKKERIPSPVKVTELRQAVDILRILDRAYS